MEEGGVGDGDIQLKVEGAVVRTSVEGESQKPAHQAANMSTFIGGLDFSKAMNGGTST